jgi:hypothetical protein
MATYIGPVYLDPQTQEIVILGANVQPMEGISVTTYDSKTGAIKETSKLISHKDYVDKFQIASQRLLSRLPKESELKKIITKNTCPDRSDLREISLEIYKLVNNNSRTDFLGNYSV